jgi:hypothetical protein
MKHWEEKQKRAQEALEWRKTSQACGAQKENGSCHVCVCGLEFVLPDGSGITYHECGFCLDGWYDKILGGGELYGS